jgi:hypothetical protein
MKYRYYFYKSGNDGTKPDYIEFDAKNDMDAIRKTEYDFQFTHLFSHNPFIMESNTPYDLSNSRCSEIRCILIRVNYDTDTETLIGTYYKNFEWILNKNK